MPVPRSKAVPAPFASAPVREASFRWSGQPQSPTGVESADFKLAMPVEEPTQTRTPASRVVVGINHCPAAPGGPGSTVTGPDSSESVSISVRVRRFVSEAAIGITSTTSGVDLDANGPGTALASFVKPLPGRSLKQIRPTASGTGSAGLSTSPRPSRAPGAET